MIKEAHLEVYDLTLTATGPVFVGNGKSISKKEYLFLDPRYDRVQRPCVVLLDEQKFFSMLLSLGLVDKFESFMLGNGSDLTRFLKQDCSISMSQIRAISRSILDASDALGANHSLKAIQCFARDPHGRPYIPGSSLKGTLRTVILADMMLDDDTKHQFSYKNSSIPEGHYLNTLELKKNSDGIVLDDAVNSILRGLSVSDSMPLDDKDMIICNKIDISPSGKKNALNLCRECLRPGTQIHFKLTLDQSVLKGKISGQSLLKSIARFAEYYQRTYMCHFRLPSFAADIGYDRSIFLGGGAGFLSKSLIYPYLGEREGLSATSKVLDMSFTNHHHSSDIMDGISPKLLKYTSYNGELYPFGLCEVKIS